MILMCVFAPVHAPVCVHTCVFACMNVNLCWERGWLRGLCAFAHPYGSSATIYCNPTLKTLVTRAALPVRLYCRCILLPLF